MTISDKISRFFTSLASTLKSIIKVILQSRCSEVKSQNRGDERLIILGNGPSLTETIADSLEILKSSPAMAVNFAANSPEFFSIRPAYYILADPHYFLSSDVNVTRLYESLNKVDWPMTLFIPFGVKRPDRLQNNCITVVRYNNTGVEGFNRVTRFLFNHRLAMPRPRNVMIPAIMIGIALGFKNIALVGADHTWTQTLSVDDNNCVVSIQPHFYKEDKSERNRVASVYKDIRLHEILLSFHVAFKSYHAIQEYASKKGVRITNATPGSFIDAFPRITL